MYIIDDDIKFLCISARNDGNREEGFDVCQDIAFDADILAKSIFGAGVSSTFRTQVRI